MYMMRQKNDSKIKLYSSLFEVRVVFEFCHR